MARLIYLAVLLATACGPTEKISELGIFPDAAPFEAKTPPGLSDSQTAAGCDSVTELGECKDGKAMKCDLAGGKVDTVDCKALAKSCVLVPNKGAGCEDIGAALGDGGAGDPDICPDTGVDFWGTCLANIAVYCDTEKMQTVYWDCTVSAATCEVDGCFLGAFCCPPETAPPADACDTATTTSTCTTDGKLEECKNGKLTTTTCPTGSACAIGVCGPNGQCC